MRYFDKSFFKFTLGFLIIIAISLLIIYATSAYASGVDKIVFTTDIQTIKPNTPSEKITIQTQDSDGNSFQTSETLTIKLVSDSPTGEFSSNNTSWKSTNTMTMNKNTANRSFYYKDSSEGNFTITISVDEKNLNASQKIAVSSEFTQDSGSGSSGGSETAEEKNVNVSTPNAKLEISAGENRTITTGSPVWFQATIKKNTTGIAPELNWSFGDGNVGVGFLVSHIYKYSGDYVAVLSAKAGDVFSVSRLKVKVIESNISVLDKGGYLEIINNGNNEINLFNWKIENEGRGFIFQPNTIISSKSSIKLDKNLLTMKGFDNSMGISLKNSLKEEIFAVVVPKINIEEIGKNAEHIKNEALFIKNKISSKTEKEIALVKTKDESKEETTETENIVYEAPKKNRVANRFFNFFVNLFR